MVGIQRPIWGSEGLVNSTSTQLIFSLLSKDLHLRLFLLHLLHSLHLVKALIVARLFVLNIHGDQLEQRLVRLFLRSYIVYFLTHGF